MAELGFVVCVVANVPSMPQARVRLDPARSPADNSHAAWRRAYRSSAAEHPPQAIDWAYTDGARRAMVSQNLAPALCLPPPPARFPPPALC